MRPPRIEALPFLNSWEKLAISPYTRSFCLHVFLLFIGNTFHLMQSYSISKNLLAS